MVVINKIVEPESELYFNDEKVGIITSSLQFNDCLLQIRRMRLNGYSILYGGEKYIIESNGRIKFGRHIYSLYSEQMKEIIGF